ncbi:MAG: SGNH/GDSL hydrolase family protein [Micromonosporaceae bacterium]
MRLAAPPGRSWAHRSGYARVIRRRTCLIAGAAVLGLCMVAFVPSAASASVGPYVSLGDSYTSGPLIPDQVGSPAGCLRSNHNFPSLVKAKLAPSSFTDVSCQGADTTNMAGSEGVPLGTNPPQFNALKSGTSLVTIQIGGNDIGFADIVTSCAELSFTNPFSSPCKNKYTSGGIDHLAAAVSNAAPKVAAVLKGIHTRSPSARVLLVGYPVILPASGNGCWPLVPIAYGDVPYLRGIEIKLNQMLAKQAAANNATFVDTYTSSVGHDVCRLPGTKWVEGLVPTAPAAPFHPNASGEKGMAQQVVAALS